ncbi:IclR family transcriptional regulator [Microbacterium sp. RD1]|uniref:IclR family transcriptional regulator n=1 Tax=Microbacterium sp. RD1 TaxID=3457313 RepID=UPI003FA607E0
MANTEQGDASTSDIQAVARVGQICALFGPGTVELSAADVAELTSLNRTTAYRYCSSMVAAGILQRGERRGTFALGRLMLELGIHALGRQRVLEVAPPHLRELRTQARMTAILSLWGAAGPVVALVEDDVSRAVVVTVRAGTRLDTTAAQTHVFLAYAGADVFEEAASGLSAAENERLRADVARVREHGYSVLPQSGGLVAAAAPVFDDEGIRASVALLGAQPREYFAEGSEPLRLLRETADAIGRELGGGRGRTSGL